MPQNASYATSSFAFDALVAGGMPPISRKVTLITGQNLVRGAVLGIITASGKYTLSASAAADGSQTPVAILADDCNASGGDAEALIYERGDFNDAKITLGAGHTVASVRAALRDVNINLVAVQPK